MNLEKQKDIFKNHIVTFTDYGNIKILDFKDPNSSAYRIRFLFEEDYCRLHISGDLGELIASNYKNMVYEKFSDFVNNVGYFETKIDCHNRNIYYYDEDKARKELLEMAEKDDWLSFSDKYDYEDDDERLNDIIDDILWDFDDERGIGSKGYDELCDLENDAFEFASDLGKEKTGILELYMLAFKLAKEQLEKENERVKREKEVITVNDLIGILDTENNRYSGATGKPRMLNLAVDGRFVGAVKEAKLDGHGDGLITDVTLDIIPIETRKTNADRIRNMTDEELAEFLCKVKSDYQWMEHEFPSEEEHGEWEKWLQSEAE